mmetsp:Transcript_13497/g.39111  ORF Transcript_13497/g.39111 Transcript_13497/m.39111 type:complete len:200 (-) Transcript_13497:1616-2215(-)
MTQYAPRMKHPSVLVFPPGRPFRPTGRQPAITCRRRDQHHLVRLRDLRHLSRRVHCRRHDRYRRCARPRFSPLPCSCPRGAPRSAERVPRRAAAQPTPPFRGRPPYPCGRPPYPSLHGRPARQSCCRCHARTRSARAMAFATAEACACLPTARPTTRYAPAPTPRGRPACGRAATRLTTPCQSAPPALSAPSGECSPPG